MSSLTNKHIVLGVTGGIAAYKAADLVRRLRDAGAEVRVVMTRAATEFVGALTFQALSGHKVHLDLLDADAEAAMSHIELARWADAVLIAPATANTLAKITQGLADDLLSTLCLATKAPLCLAPSMNHVMWSDAHTQANIKHLQQGGVKIFGPASGSQACGETGEGRMLEPLQLVEQLAQIFSTGSLQGCRLLITAGPTFEAIDPVRFIGNRSSGKMGYALAQAAAEAGAQVTLVSGPVTLATPDRVTRINVESAAQMHQAVMQHIASQNIFIACAAVADYRPAQSQPQKIKKTADKLQIDLVKNPDILGEVASMSQPPFCIGFAAETENLRQHAQQKLSAKKLHMIAANDVSSQDSGFNSEFNALHIFWPDGDVQLEKASKPQIARQMISLVAQHYSQNQTQKKLHEKNSTQDS
ncbi:MAG TPA: bifunctional phosphopantothenoylcysteine decarboxylase/phosphopantothenate--cysteine ligase CoaBC [Gammaproteobacteria bacterium]|nr:bifunctional phosphopantothenoylcysteine decarboxylase/phosphopantothenate--cysteine ligase CoaBC [Gammaproteobacteria bacterium]